MDALVRSQESVPAHSVERSQDAFVQVLIGPEDGTVHAVVRRFTLLPGGRIPRHKHPTVQHQQYVLSGQMRVGIGPEVREVRAGDALLIPPDIPHWYENHTGEPVRFLCIIPRTSGYATVWLDD